MTQVLQLLLTTGILVFIVKISIQLGRALEQLAHHGQEIEKLWKAHTRLSDRLFHLKEDS